MNKLIGMEVLLTGDDIRRWQGELQKAEATKAEAEARIADLRRKLEAALILAGASFPLPSSTEVGQEDEGQESMADAARRLLAGFPKPIPHHVLQIELRKIPRIREMLDKNKGAYYYTMIARLVTAGDIKRVGKKIRLIHKNETPPEGSPEGAPKATVEG